MAETRYRIATRCGDGFGTVEVHRPGQIPGVLAVCTCDGVSDETVLALAREAVERIDAEEPRG